MDKPESESEKKIKQESYPTIWNHMEAAMAYSQNVPLLILVERGLKRQGMLSDRLEWKAIEADMSPSLISTEEFQQVFREWIEGVRSKRKSPTPAKVPDGKWKVKDLISVFLSLEVRDARAIIVVFFAALAAISIASYKIGQWTITSAPVGARKTELGALQDTKIGNQQIRMPNTPPAPHRRELYRMG